jgi:heptaprenyl diphosphate synthase
MKTNKIALLGIFGAVALVLSFLESMLVPDIPFLPVGAKPGLSNIVTMYIAGTMGFPGAIYITMLKALFALITRGATGAFMSFSGGLLSTTAVCLLIKYQGRIFSWLGIGIIGAVMHNLGQLMAACVVSGTFALINYGKYLLIFALITGTVTGSVLLVLMPRLEKTGRNALLRAWTEFNDCF